MMGRNGVHLKKATMSCRRLLKADDDDVNAEVLLVEFNYIITEYS